MFRKKKNGEYENSPPGQEERIKSLPPRKVVYFEVEVMLKTLLTVNFNDGILLYNKWEAWFNTHLQQNATLGLENGFQFSPISWHYMFLQQKLEEEVMSGIGISLVLAGGILVLATGNYIIGLCSIFTISYIISGTMAFAVLKGWKLGVIEAVNLVMVVGLAVDYCVHLSEAYIESRHKDRSGRVIDMLGKLGGSILSGAGSTVGSMSFLLASSLIFFTKFALFIAVTIILSTIISLVFYSALLSVVGPEGGSGSIYDEHGKRKPRVFACLALVFVVIVAGAVKAMK